MSQENGKGSSFSKFIGQTQVSVLGLLGFIVTVVSFIQLVQENTGLVTLSLLAVGVLLLWLACLYFARLWKPEQLDGKAGLILPAPTNEQVLRQRKKEQQRKVSSTHRPCWLSISSIACRKRLWRMVLYTRTTQ